MECGECGAAVRCKHCNVSMAWHKGENLLKCHYCGRSAPAPEVCPVCGKGVLKAKGFGTEKVEQELAKLFPRARVERLDGDVAASPKRYDSVVASFERGATDILVGTQMIAKGFDFGGVSLVGILNADNLLAFPDFRAAERAFQVITQMAGRGGRRGERSGVVIQTSQPESPIILQAADCDYEAMAADQLSERAEYGYPPYVRLIEVTLKHKDKDALWAGANALAVAGRTVFGRALLGPQSPLVDKVRGEYVLMFLLKIGRGASFADARRRLKSLLEALKKHKMKISCNVDPQ